MQPADIKPLLVQNSSKIVLLILDGLGGIPMKPGGHTSLEAANTPNMDQLAQNGSLGSIVPIRPGITPGSGPAHLSLFGYDPIEHEVGRGVLEAKGIGIDVRPGDVAARGNFCTLDQDGNITDRRAGRISSDEGERLVKKLEGIKMDGLEITVRHLKEYRFALVLRGAALNAGIADTDPQVTGRAPLEPKANEPAAVKTALLFKKWISEAEKILSEEKDGNGVTLRGFGSDPQLDNYKDLYGLNAACIAVYPMYKGVAKLVGMDVIEFEGDSPADEFGALKNVWDDYDYFFVHIKKTDSMGEDGDFDGKVGVIESVDQAIHALTKLNPDVLMITGDHSTPAKMKSHSWHPVPFLLWAPERGLPDTQDKFGERNCAAGGLGRFPAYEIPALALAHAGRLQKYGA